MEILKYIREQWDRVGAGVGVGLGAIVLLLGWIGVSNKIYPGEQIPYVVSAGLGGLFLLAVGAVLWISADLRDEWRKLDDLDDSLHHIEEAIRRGVPDVDALPAASARAAGASRSRRDGPTGQSRPLRARRQVAEDPTETAHQGEPETRRPQPKVRSRA
jgi:hypothetical protein